jgi:hypothetical protein
LKSEVSSGHHCPGFAFETAYDEPDVQVTRGFEGAELNESASAFGHGDRGVIGKSLD